MNWNPIINLSPLSPFKCKRTFLKPATFELKAKACENEAKNTNSERLTKPCKTLKNVEVPATKFKLPSSLQL
jgi:hypothetical protein